MAPPSTACSLMPVTRRNRVLGAGNASVTFNSGTLNVSAIRPRGILAWVDGNGSATVTTGAGTVINVSGTQFGGPGVYLFSSGTATAPNALTANVASTNHECPDRRSPIPPPTDRSVFEPIIAVRMRQSL